MTVPAPDLASLQRWTSLEPYAQLFRALLPRATGVAVFDAKGELRWSSESAMGSDVQTAVEESVASASRLPEEHGELRILDGTRRSIWHGCAIPEPVCWRLSQSPAVPAPITKVRPARSRW